LEPEFLKVFDKTAAEYPHESELKKKALEVRQKASTLAMKGFSSPFFGNSKNLPLIQQAVANTNKMLTLKPGMFTPVSPKESAEHLPKNTSSGFPEYIGNKGEILDYTVAQCVEALNQGNPTWVNFIVTMAWRTQVRPTGLKYRIIWVTPYISQIFENCFFLPISRYFSNFKTSPWCVGNVFTDLVPRIKQLRNYSRIVVIDYKSFDQTVPLELILLFFNSIKSCFKINSKLWDIQYTAVMHFNASATCLNLLNGEAAFIPKAGGLSSGSVFTNFMGSWINLFLMNLYLGTIKQDPFACYLNVMGDDCSHGFNFDFDVHDYARWLEHNFGMIVNPEECQVLGPDFETIEFLGADVNEKGRYMNKSLVIDQLIISTHFIPNTVMSDEERLVSKLASITFKFTDGYKFFDEVMDKLALNLDLSKLPKYYYELFYSPAGPFEMFTKRSIDEFKFTGWMRQ